MKIIKILMPFTIILCSACAAKIITAPSSNNISSQNIQQTAIISDGNKDNDLNDTIFDDQELENKEKKIFENKDDEKLLSEQEKNNNIRLTIKESELLYKQALSSCKNGNNAKARDLFNESLNKLLSVNMDSSAFYEMQDEFNKIFEKLNIHYTKTTQAGNQNVKDKYKIPMDIDNPLVQKYLKSYSEGQVKSIIQKAFNRSGRYREMIINILKEYDLPEELVCLPVVESLYSIDDLSSAGALGLWQIMPHRARALGLKVNYWIDERKDPEKSTRAAAKYLKELYLMFDDWHMALAAYNRGEFGLARDLNFSRATNIDQMSERHAVPKETELYVPKFIACALIADNPEKYGFDINFEPSNNFDKVSINKIIDLKIVAECADTDIDSIKKLNPAIKAWCTPYNYPDFELLLPYGKKDSFLQNIAKIKDLNPSSGYIKYKVKKGDCLSSIAGKFYTSISRIKEDNKIKNTGVIRISQTLVIRPGKKYMAQGTAN